MLESLPPQARTQPSQPRTIDFSLETRSPTDSPTMLAAAASQVSDLAMGASGNASPQCNAAEPRATPRRRWLSLPTSPSRDECVSDCGFEVAACATLESTGADPRGGGAASRGFSSGSSPAHFAPIEPVPPLELSPLHAQPSNPPLHHGLPMALTPQATQPARHSPSSRRTSRDDSDVNLRSSSRGESESFAERGALSDG